MNRKIFFVCSCRRGRRDRRHSADSPDDYRCVNAVVKRDSKRDSKRDTKRDSERGVPLRDGR
jgi:hypothetical protein